MSEQWHRLSKRCPNCHAVHHQNFCGDCGTLLTGVSMDIARHYAWPGETMPAEILVFLARHDTLLDRSNMNYYCRYCFTRVDGFACRSCGTL